MPTINPNLSNGKLIVIRVATAATGLLPVSPSGRHAITMLWPLIEPKYGSIYLCLLRLRAASDALSQVTLLLQLALLLEHKSSPRCNLCTLERVPPLCDKDNFLVDLFSRFINADARFGDGRHVGFMY